MTGILCAQSMGEPLTQMSMIYDTPIKVYNINNDVVFNGMMGEFCDNIINNTKSDKSNDSIVVDVSGFKIHSVDTHGKVKLSEIKYLFNLTNINQEIKLNKFTNIDFEH